MNDEPSEVAMRTAAAAKSAGLAGFREGMNLKIWLKDLATIINNGMKREWILCSKRMPTEEDVDENGEVYWFDGRRRFTAGYEAYLDSEAFAKDTYSWQPLPAPPEES